MTKLGQSQLVDRSTSGDDASRTFQSIFGGQPRAAKDEEDEFDSNERIEMTGNESDDLDELWDDDDVPDVPSQRNNTSVFKPSVSVDNRRSMQEWAEDDEEEESWKEALQTRVNQLDLVVQNNVVEISSTALVDEQDENCSYPSPVDQRATLALLAKPQPVQSSSTGAKLATASQLKTQQRTTTGRQKGVTPPTKTTSASSTSAAQSRKNSHLHEPVTRPTTTRGDPKSTTHQIHKTSRQENHVSTSGVFVRAVVARTQISQRIEEPRRSAHATPRQHTKETNGLSEAERLRRVVLDDLLKMSVERIVADAKRLRFLEELCRRQSTSTAAPASSTTS